MKHKISFFNCVRLCLMLVLSIGFTSQLKAQNTITVNGTVSDKAGEAVIGASVSVKGTTIGTFTDLDGHFTLPNVPKDGNIQVSYIGYNAQTIQVNNQTKILITLVEDSQALNEVVVVGYGVMRKSDLTGAVASVKASDALKSTPSGNITDALQGRMSGVSIVSGSGDPSNNNTIRIRGINSVTAEGGPLLVIDGFIGGSLNALNPADIQSIEVLKDASASAVYGSRGANGVILVTTKNPKSENVVVNFNTFMNWKKAPSYDDLLSPYDFAELANAHGREYNASMNKAPKVYYDDAQLEAFRNGSEGYNYMNAIFRDPSLEQNYELSLSGGGDKTSFLASLRYNKNEGTIKRNQSEIYNYRLKLDTKVKKWLKVGLNLYGSYATNTGPRVSQYNSVLTSAMFFPNTMKPTNADGEYNNTLALGGGGKYNPMAYINEVDKNNTTLTNYLQGYVDFNILDGLTFRSQLGITFSNQNNDESSNARSYYAFTNGNDTYAMAYSKNGKSWLNTNTLSYIKEFNSDHRINATAVFEQSYDNSYWHRSEATKLHFPDILGSNGLGSADNFQANSERVISTLQSYMFRLNYVFKNRYMLTASMRADGSSRLNSKWDYFPSAAVAWDIRQEAFMQNADWVSQLKFRIGYGSVGNQSVEPYRIYSKMEPSKSSSGTIYQVLRSKADYLEWERNDQVNVGVDLGFFNGRLTINGDWYNKKSKKILLDVEQPIHVGYPELLKNAGEITNKGIEITIGADPIIGKEWQWHTDVTLSHNKGVFTEIPAKSGSQTLPGSYEKAIIRMIQDEKIASFWGVTYDGVWQQHEVDAMYVGADGKETGKTNGTTYGVQAGSAKYRDTNNDGKIDNSDAGIIGNGQPTFNWGWNNTVSYRNFDLSVFIVGFHGFDIYNATDQMGYGLIDSQPFDLVTPKKDLLNRWTPTNTNSNIPGFVYEAKPIKLFSSRFVEKGDFVKVKSITLGYNIPALLCQKWQINSLRVYGSIQNPFMITSYNGLDPESTLGNPLTQGTDWGAYPNSRNFILGLNFSF